MGIDRQFGGVEKKLTQRVDYLNLTTRIGCNFQFRGKFIARQWICERPS